MHDWTNASSQSGDPGRPQAGCARRFRSADAHSSGGTPSMELASTGVKIITCELARARTESIFPWGSRTSRPCRTTKRQRCAGEEGITKRWIRCAICSRRIGVPARTRQFRRAAAVVQSIATGGAPVLEVVRTPRGTTIRLPPLRRAALARGNRNPWPAVAAVSPERK